MSYVQTLTSYSNAPASGYATLNVSVSPQLNGNGTITLHIPDTDPNVKFSGGNFVTQYHQYAGVVSPDGKTMSHDVYYGDPYLGFFATIVYPTGTFAKNSVVSMAGYPTWTFATSIANTSAGNDGQGNATLTYQIGSGYGITYTLTESPIMAGSSIVSAQYSTNGGSTWNTFSGNLVLPSTTSVMFKGTFNTGGQNLFCGVDVNGVRYYTQTSGSNVTVTTPATSGGPGVCSIVLYTSTHPM